MSGLIFMRTSNLEETTEFYRSIGMVLWIEQPDINILRSNNLIIGFQQHDIADTDAMITFFYQTKEEVDTMYEKLHPKQITLSEPKENDIYNIYNFFAEDPEGRKIEFQKFLHDLPDFEF